MELQPQNLKGISLFKDNKHYSYIYQKTQKLVTGLYLVTDLLKDNEPLKWQTRECGLSLLSENMSLISSLSAEKNLILKKLSSTALKVVSLIEIGHTAGLISSMNFSLLKREFIDLVTFIEETEMKGQSLPSVFLNEDFLKVDDGNVSTSNTSITMEKALDKGHDKGHLKPFASKPVVSIKDRELIKIHKSGRQETIVALIRKNKEVTIKDLVSSITDCSEKTIQRELLTLVSKGVLKKVGERRWSKYSLK